MSSSEGLAGRRNARSGGCASRRLRIGINGVEDEEGSLGEAVQSAVLPKGKKTRRIGGEQEEQEEEA